MPLVLDIGIHVNSAGEYMGLHIDSAGDLFE